MRIFRILLLALALICLVNFPGLGAEVMPWVAPTSIGGFNVEVYYANLTQEFKLDITGYRVPYDYVSQKINLKATLRPGVGFELYGLIGVIGSELKGGSLSYKGEMDGTAYGGGVRYVLLGDIFILPALSFELGVNRYSSSLTKENGKKINFRFETTELQGCVMMSKGIATVTPYLGVKFFHNWANWEDEAGGDKGKGSSGDLSPFLGGKVSFLPFLSIKGEISLGDERTYAGGINLSFGL